MSSVAPTVRFAALPIGRPPAVAGVVSRLETLRQVAASPLRFPCHLIELRLGEVDPRSDWDLLCARIEAAGRPVLATLRNDQEGGRWADRDPARLDAFARALGVCAAVDVEWRSALRDPVLELAARAGKPVVLSTHHFSATPPLADLLALADAMSARPGVVAKFAFAATGPADVENLHTLLHAPFPAPRCVIAMGPLGARTRVDFAREGSCLTYGWLDEPTAPGQPSCRELLAALAPSLSPS